MLLLVSDNIPEFSVSELSSKVKKTVEDAFGYVRVRAELGRVSRHSSGHVYLDLKDNRAVLASVIWKGVANRLKIAPEQGMEVIATGRLTTYPGQSKYQMQIERLEPAGAGALMALYEERKKRLAGEGLFDPSRKKPLPKLPQVIGVVTSPTGAVIRDILHRLKDRYPCHVVVWPAAVQGERAVPQIIAGISGFNRAGTDFPDIPRPDVIIVARGGGSLEDLWCFNDEGVARAAAASNIPLISAVGHETDTTLIDFVADQRAPTPSAAAEIAVPVRLDLLQNLEAREGRLVTVVARILETNTMGLSAAARGLGRPEALIATATQSFDHASERLLSAIRRRSDRAKARFDTANAAFHPARIAEGATRAAENVARAGERLRLASMRRLELADGRVKGHRLPKGMVVKMLRDGANNLAGASARFGRASVLGLEQATQKLHDLDRLLTSYSYHGVLERGFALVLDEQQKVIRRVDHAAVGAAVTLRFADGHRAATLGQAVSGTVAKAKKPQPKKTSARKPPADQGGLFD